MTVATRETLFGQLRKGEIAPLYVLHGPEDYLRARAAASIADAALRDAPLREFNENRFSLSSADIRQVIAAADQMPMMASRRVVLVTDFGKLSEADELSLMNYISRPAPSSVVIFIADDLDKRRKMTKTLLQECVSVEFRELTESEILAWAKKRLRDLRVDADDRTLGQIVALVGRSVRRVALELDKLATAAIETGRITFEMVDNLVGRSRELSNFELTDNLIARNRARALQTLHRLLDDRVEPLMLVGLIASNYHRLALTKALMAAHAGEDEVFRLVPMPFNKRREFLQLARRTDAGVLARSIERIAAADLAIKTSRATPRIQLEMLICELSA